MEELRLHKIILRTPNTHDLESFLVEVLGAEITPIVENSFLAEVAGVTFDVRPGTPVLDAFEFSVSASFLADIISRWEFYCFRRGAHKDVSVSKTQFSCHDADGREWILHTAPMATEEYPPNYVRNC